MGHRYLWKMNLSLFSLMEDGALNMYSAILTLFIFLFFAFFFYFLTVKGIEVERAG